MKVSLGWLQELVDAPLDGDRVSAVLTAAGIEVEGRHKFGDFSGVVVAEVRGKKPHPGASKLTLVEVFDGVSVTQVVCGAANVPSEGLVLWARPGAKMPDGRVLEPKEVRGVVSPGMLCAEDELGLGASHDGILILDAASGLVAGDDFGAKLGLPDEILELNVTPNRADCLGHIGVATELAALLGVGLKAPAPRSTVATTRVDGTEAELVRLEDPAGCPRYTALRLDGVKVGPSPIATKLRLASLGLRAISNIVDATNWVLLETGQPIHAFDFDKLAGGRIVVRRARAGETLQTLDGQDRVLDENDLLIADAEKPLAVAGVMGGQSSEVGPETTRILVESASFDASSVRRSAKRLGLRTEASHRFERGVDPSAVEDASRRCAALVRHLAGGTESGTLVDVCAKPARPVTVTLRPARTVAVLGTPVSSDEQRRILTALGLAVTARGDVLEVVIPTRRPDLTREIDLIEEVARVRGYDLIPSTLPLMREAPSATSRSVGERTRDLLTGLGFDEIVTYGFVGPESLKAMGWPEEDRRAQPLALTNPIREELSTMRTALVPALLAVLQRNQARGMSSARIFEVGTVFLRSSSVLPEEHRAVAAVAFGTGDGWLRPGAELDFFDLKGIVEELLSGLGVAAVLAAPESAEPWLHPGVQAAVLVDGMVVGHAGELHPAVGRRFGLETRVIAFELGLHALASKPVSASAELPRFPAVTRDLSFFIATDTPAAAMRAALEGAKEPLLVALHVLEDYREAGRVPEGKKGMLWSFTYRAADRTLTDAEVQVAHEGLIAALRQALPVDLR